ncbi:hypothetical protein H6G89_11870 [Oscillatoria sp. FACHB-1407]|uniref:hypothetical protein n=1 Tax=Oscillatoria sp. FACHB-1407 TaxID=2692847 RepID=UPI0016899949|nr:hypothetical protein [Oscillatoria sp. FACHB-1407]MBD2461749.1 hypothetical protein [Oscillatoria sp. FACHB-1407]
MNEPHPIPQLLVFDHMAVGRTLLILGEPGSGKTITLLKLAQNLLARTEADLVHLPPQGCTRVICPSYLNRP